ncbi:hypothetical protein EVAR_20991_1 [Eumeta japonica]|uniref:Uncharacterized protein n=1 Tax=Eumeta variegata TaxID=151549 RepID=A0A4C1V5W4_EUMVA|nr:hypothetical protein EVAR_20991_1 [Eumeta japonica]
MQCKSRGRNDVKFVVQTPGGVRSYLPRCTAASDGTRRTQLEVSVGKPHSSRAPSREVTREKERKKEIKKERFIRHKNNVKIKKSSHMVIRSIPSPGL